MKLCRLLSLLILCFVTASAPAEQVVMDFNDLANTSALNSITSPYARKGLRLTNPSNWYLFGPGSGRDTGHKALSNQFTVTMTTLTLEGGGPFTLVSMRLSPFSANSPANVTFTGTKANGSTVTQTLPTGSSLAGVVGTFNSNFQDVVSVAWNMSTLSDYHQFDDITAIIPAKLTVSPADTLTESVGSATVGVTLSSPLPSAASVTYTIADGTATQPSDYTRPGGAASGTLTIPSGQTSALLTIPIVNDATAEALETFTVTFSNPPAGTSFLGGPTATVVSIANDDNIADFAGWMAAHGLTANAALADADPNNDGVSNLESWLLRINPAGPSPTTWMARRPAYLISTDNRPALRFTVPSPAPTDVSIAFEETTVLSSWIQQANRGGFGTASLWAGSGASRVTDTVSAGTHTITCAGSLTIPARPKVFLRLKYTLISAGGGGT